MRTKLLVMILGLIILSTLDYGRKIVCVVSGGNIDASKLSSLLAGKLP